MPGSTTEILNDDIKELKAEFKELEVDIRRHIDGLKDDFHKVAVGVAELRGDLKDEINVLEGTLRRNLDLVKDDLNRVSVGAAELRGELKVVLGVAKWAGALIVTTVLTTGVAGIWWASSINAKVDEIGKEFEANDERLGKIERSIGQILEQVRPAPTVPKPSEPATSKP